MSEATLPFNLLVELLERADQAYWVDANPIMSDFEYDGYCRQYETQAKKKWEYLGAASAKGMKKVRHEKPMLSLDKIRTVAELRAWLEKLPANHRKQVSGTSKIDGLAIRLVYRKGKLVIGATRGDGENGEDITANLAYVMGIPQELPAPDGAPLPSEVEVRGECVMTWTDLETINAAIVAEGGDEVEDVFKNPRNATSGIVRRKTVQKNQIERVQFVAYSMPTRPDDVTTHEEELGCLAGLGFQIPSVEVYPVTALTRGTDEDLIALFTAHHKVACPWPTDGVVLKVLESEAFEELGATSHHPIGAVAFKFPDEIKRTTLRAIRWQSGRTGILTPVAEFDEVQLEGTTVKRATLCNLRRVNIFRLKIGQSVGVRKAGSIIPELLAEFEGRLAYEDLATGKVRFVDDESEVPTSLTYDTPTITVRDVVPDVCPSCAGTVTVDYPHLRCINPTCPPKLIRSIVHAASRKELNIQGLGPEVARALVGSRQVENLADLWELQADAVEAMVLSNGQAYKRKRTDVLFGSLAEVQRRATWPELLHALGCPGLGRPECEAIDAAGIGLEQLLTNTRDYKSGVGFKSVLVTLPGVGHKTAEALVVWLRENQEWLHRFLVNGFNVSPTPKADVGDRPLDGIVVVLTGNLGRPRPDLEKELKVLGAKTTGSVSKKTTYLVAGDKAGGDKLEAAANCGVRILHAEGLAQLLKGEKP